MFQILVVEDDKELCDLFCTVLTDNGYTAVPAADGLAAFDILDDTYIDLVISDIMMPRMDGFELTKALRESGYSMPILIITAKESATDKREGFRLGTDDYMVKPIDVNEMVWRVEALLRRSRRPAVPTLLRRAAAAALVLLLGCGSWLTLDAEAREDFTSWVRGVYEDMIIYHATDIQISEKQDYLPGWIPEGYTERFRESDDQGFLMVFQLIFAV